MSQLSLTPPPPDIKEGDLQLQLRKLFTLAGGRVYDRSQGYRKERGGTRMTPGLADLEIHFPLTIAVFEVKTPKGLRDHHKLLAMPKTAVAPSRMNDWRRAHAQRAYGEACALSRTPYAIGGIEAAQDLLISLGLAKRENGMFILTPQGKRPLFNRAEELALASDLGLAMP